MSRGRGGRLSDDLATLFRKGAGDPPFFVEQVVGMCKLWGRQKDIMLSVRDNSRTVVRSCNGVGKCQSAESDVILGDGSVVKARDLIGRTFTVPSYDNGRVTIEKAWAFDNGVKPVYRLTTVQGKVIERTGNHPVMSAVLHRYRGIKRSGLDWVCVEDLTEGHAVLLPKELRINNVDYAISDCEIKLLAYLLADSGTTKCVAFSQKENWVKEEFRGIVEGLGCWCKDVDGVTLKVLGTGKKQGNRVLNLVREWGLFGKRSVDKVLPHFVWRFSDRQIKLFLNRFLACDGYAYNNKVGRGQSSIGTCLASEALIRGLEILFLRVGFVVKVRCKPVKYKDKINDSWELAIHNQKDIGRFADEINIYGKEDAVLRCVREADESKTQKWKVLGVPEGFILDRVKKVECLGEMPTVGISVDRTHTYITTVVEHNTFTTANIVAWFLASHPGSVVISTAPTARQVRELLWQEIRSIHANSKFPLGGSTTTVSWTLGEKWFALGLSTDDPNRFQGFHAEHILGVIDEGAGVEPPIWEAMDAILTSSGARLLAIGNPTEPSGRFYDAFASPLFNKLAISAFDTPNFTENGIILEDIKSGLWEDKVKKLIYPALITPRWVSERFSEWGEESPAFQSRVMGNFPTIGSDTMIPLGWVLKARERELAYEDSDRVIMGIDVARFGDDKSTIGVRRGNSLTRLEQFKHVDVHALSKAAQMVADEEKPEFIKVDVVGIGAGVADNLRAWGYKAIDFVAQGRAFATEKFVNRRTEAWYNTREKFRKNEINLPKGDEIMVGQLTSPRYEFDVSGRYKLEAKDRIKERLGYSPDIADVIVMCFESDEDFETSVSRDFIERVPKTGTVEALLRELSKGEVDEVKWHSAIF